MRINNKNTPDEISCWPHWLSSTKLPFTSLRPEIADSNGFSWFGGRDIVCTGNNTDGGRFVVVVVVNGDRTNDVNGLKTLLSKCNVKEKHWIESVFVNDYRFVVKGLDVSSSSMGQHTPGMNKRLKQSESRKPERLSNKLGQTLKSSHRPDVPNGVVQRFSPSFPSTSSIYAAWHRYY